MENEEQAEVLLRYLDCQVTVSAYGHSRFVGTVTKINSDFLVLSNVWIFSEYESGPWEEKIIKDNLRDGSEIGEREVLIKLHNVTAVSCDDPLLPVLKFNSELEAKATELQIKEDPTDAEELGLQLCDPVLLKLGFALTPKFDDIVNRTSRMRKDLSDAIGLRIPKIRITSSSVLDPNAYEIRMGGVKTGGAQVNTDKSMALINGEPVEGIEGEPGIDPAFGLKVLWIEGEQSKAKALEAGCTVVDSQTVIETHLSKLISDFRHDLLTYQHIESSLKNLAQTEPALVNEFYSASSNKMCLYQIIRELLLEQVWVGDFTRIAHAVACHSSREFYECYQRVRDTIGAMIFRDVTQTGEGVPIISFDENITNQLEKHQLPLSPLIDIVRDKVLQHSLECKPIVALFPASVRRQMGLVFRKSDVACLAVSVAEIPEAIKLDYIDGIRLSDVEQRSSRVDESSVNAKTTPESAACRDSSPG